jgi:hypothetical protein
MSKYRILFLKGPQCKSMAGVLLGSLLPPILEDSASSDYLPNHSKTHLPKGLQTFLLIDVCDAMVIKGRRFHHKEEG